MQRQAPRLPFMGQARRIAKDDVLDSRRLERLEQSLGAAVNSLVEPDVPRVQVQEIDPLVELCRVGEYAAEARLDIHAAAGAAKGADGLAPVALIR